MILKLFNKFGTESETGPLPNRWGEVHASLAIKRDQFMFPTTIYNDLQRVHSFVKNNFFDASEMETYGKKEYWATVDQVLMRGGGDCEDHAILKWGLLHDMGYPLDLFSIAVVYNRKLEDHHAVLVCMGENESMVLDNLVPSIYPDREQQWYDPLYAFGYSRKWYF